MHFSHEPCHKPTSIVRLMDKSKLLSYERELYTINANLNLDYYVLCDISSDFSFIFSLIFVSLYFAELDHEFMKRQQGNTKHVKEAFIS